MGWWWKVGDHMEIIPSKGGIIRKFFLDKGRGGGEQQKELEKNNKTKPYKFLKAIYDPETKNCRQLKVTANCHFISFILFHLRAIFCKNHPDSPYL